MRLVSLLLLALVFAAPAAAAGPRFGLFDLSDLSRTSHNEFGDVRVSQRTTALRGTVVHCGTGCRFGSGWLAFAKAPSLNAGDVVYIPGNEMHQFFAAGDEPFGFLCVVPAMR